MIGAMTIITTFLSPYVIKLGWKITKSKDKPAASEKEEEKTDAPASDENKGDG
jgi:CPA2 family monovalent cation:H+ antiporter-2